MKSSGLNRWYVKPRVPYEEVSYQDSKGDERVARDQFAVPFTKKAPLKGAFFMPAKEEREIIFKMKW